MDPGNKVTRTPWPRGLSFEEYCRELAELNSGGNMATEDFAGGGPEGLLEWRERQGATASQYFKRGAGGIKRERSSY